MTTAFLIELISTTMRNNWTSEDSGSDSTVKRAVEYLKEIGKWEPEYAEVLTQCAADNSRRWNDAYASQYAIGMGHA